MPTKTPEQVLSDLLRDADQAADAEIDRIVAMSTEALKESLRADGIDPDADVAKGRAFREGLIAAEPAGETKRTRDARASGPVSARVPLMSKGAGAEEASRNAVPKPSYRSRRVARWGSITGLGIAAGVSIIVLVVQRSSTIFVKPADVAVHTAPEPIIPAAPLRPNPAALRMAGITACNHARFDECRRALDDAKQLDPAGDQSPAVRAARQLLEDHPPLLSPDATDRGDKAPR